jgi:AbrB family looped-hinge helix DNA binding protein
MTTRLSTKGQLILPKEIRERHGWGPGVELEIEERGNSVVLRRAVAVPETTLEELLGCTGYQGPAHSLEEMALRPTVSIDAMPPTPAALRPSVSANLRRWT